MVSSPASANSATWWSLMENSDTEDDEPYKRRQTNNSKAPRNHSYGSPSLLGMPHGSNIVSGVHSSSRRSPHHSSHRRSSAPMPQHSSDPRYSDYDFRPATPSRSLKRSVSEKASRRVLSERSSPRKHVPRTTPRNNHSGSLGDDEDSAKKIRWDQPTTHRYQLAEQPRLLEEKILNVLDSVQTNMGCSQDYQKSFTGASNLVWSLLETNQKSRDISLTQRHDGSSQAQSTEEGSEEDSIFEDGPSVVEISGTPPVFSESITASESLLSGSTPEYDDENDEKSDVYRHSTQSLNKYHPDDYHRKRHGDLPADSSQILDELSGMESERRSSQSNSDKAQRNSKKTAIEYDNAPNSYLEPESAANKEDVKPAVKLYSTALPFEITKEKKCPVGIHALQDIKKARNDKTSEKKRSDSLKKMHKALRRKLKENPHIPPVPDIQVGASQEVSTITASEGSYHHKSYGTGKGYPGYTGSHNFKLDKSSPSMGEIPENRGLKIESHHSKIIFDNSFQDETKSCIPISFQRKKRGTDGATASFSSKSLGMRLLSRSGDANTTSEKENNEESQYIYEYESGINTYVAYFEPSQPRETKPPLQLIEHPNPPLLPFGSNEVVVKIEASTISQSDCAIRRGEWWGGTLSLPRIPGVAFAGKIDQIHKTGRNSMQVGDQVLSLVCSGGNSRYVCIPRDRLVKVPNNVVQESAKVACLPEIYLSAFQIIHHGQNGGARYRKNALAGKSIMFLGGATALGQAIMELSIEAGAAVVYATANKVKQFQRIIEIGGIPLNDNPAELLATINQQVDILIGSTTDSLKDTDLLTYDHLNVLKQKGQLVLLGGPGGGNEYPVIHPGKSPSQVDVFKILKKAYKHNVFENWERDMKQGKRDLNHLISLLQRGVLKPKTLERIPLSKVGKAEDIIEAQRLHGVIICEPWVKNKRR